jgi:hypothetical protein
MIQVNGNASSQATKVAAHEERGFKAVIQLHCWMPE